MSTCAICAAEITAANDSEEHIIPNAIGGRKRVRGFLCKACNSKSGETWDAEVAQQLHPLSLLFLIARERGVPPPLKVVTSKNEQLTISNDRLTPSHPIFIEKATPQGKVIEVAARSEKEARSILEGLKRKHPSIDVDAVMAQAQVVETYPKGTVHHQIGFAGPIAGRSIVKSCLALAHSVGFDWAQCGTGVTYLRDASADHPFGFFYESDIVIGRDETVPLHCVHISANPTTGYIIGYAEYYGMYRVIVGLGDHYDGPQFQATYAIDPRWGQQVDVRMGPIDFTDDDLRDIYEYKRIPDGAMAAAANPLIGEAMKRKNAAEQVRAVKSAVEYAFENCGAKEGDVLSEEHVRKVSKLAAEKLMPFLLHRMRGLDR